MKTVFVVDDNTVNLVTADEKLSDSYNVFTFACASTMLEFLNDIKPDLILLDIMMPGIDGFETLKRLKADKRHTEIPIIFMTGKNEIDFESFGYKMGVIDYLSKPFCEPVLNKFINMYIKR